MPHYITRLIANFPVQPDNAYFCSPLGQFARKANVAQNQGHPLPISITLYKVHFLPAQYSIPYFPKYVRGSVIDKVINFPSLNHMEITYHLVSSLRA